MRERRGSAQFWMIVGAVAVLLWWVTTPPSLAKLIESTATDLKPGAAGSRIVTIAHGEEVTLETATFPGKVTIFDFYSDGCPPCVMLKPILHAVVEKEPGLALHVIDINRKGKTGIDWGSPVAQQHKLSGIPYLVIFDGNGTEIARGDGARKMLATYVESTSR